jgi:hypothetical protein
MRQHRSIARDLTWITILAVALAGCAASATPLEEPRHPEKKRPEPARSASDGEVLGAHGQSPEDTLEGSPTNEHAAPGWEEEEPEDCAKTPEAKEEAAAATTPTAKKKRPCPPAEPQ